MPSAVSSAARWLSLAVPKGRVLAGLARHLRARGFDTGALLRDDRTLVREDARARVRYLLLKPDDVPTYVEHGAADLGVVGRDILLERDHELSVPIDLGLGACRLVLAAADPRVLGRDAVLRVATKYPAVATRYFLSRGRQVETVFVQSSVELAPRLGLADCIVDLVETGETLRQNGLVELETLHRVTSVLVANPAALKLSADRVRPFLERLRPSAAARRRGAGAAPRRRGAS